MLIVIGLASGLLFGVQLAACWGLRRSRGGWPDVLVVGLGGLPIAYFWGADAFGWPTPGSIAESSGLMNEPVDRALLAVATIVTAVVALAVLVSSGVTRRLERWSATSE